MWLRSVDPKRDTYISQAEFFAPKRRIATLRSIGLVWADCGDDGRFSHLEERVAVKRIREVISEAGIPDPSIIVSSGRGYHPKWIFERGVPAAALPRWSAVERAITGTLKDELDADPKATDAARVLRLAGTLNTRNGKIAHIAYRNDVNGEPYRYDFEQFCRDVLQYERPGTLTSLDKAPKAKRAATGFRTYTIGTLWWGRYLDLRRLCELRGWGAPYGVPEGFRDLVLFFFSVALSWVALPQNWWFEVLAIASEFTPALKDHERRSFVGTVYRRLMASKVPGGQEVRYRYSTARMIQDLGISRQEMRSLKHLVAPEIARERKLLRDAENAALKRSEASTETKVKRAIRDEKIRRMHNEGANVSLIAATLGISRPTVYAALQGDDVSP